MKATGFLTILLLTATPVWADAAWSDFPNLHPLIVHFPIVLLIAAALFQAFSLFVLKRELSTGALILIVLGAITAFIATEFSHPHVSGLTEEAQHIFDEHEEYADYTLYLSIIAAVFKLSTLFFSRKLFFEIIIALVMLSAAVAVSLAGHHGSELVFIEGVGPQGKFLEDEH